MPKSKSKPRAKAHKPMPSSLVTFLLDRSGSMHVCKKATIEGFNAYIGGLQAEKQAKIGFTFLQFDTESLDKVHVDVPVAQVPNLNDSTYQPRGGTPLIDAAVKTIHAVAEAVGRRDDKPKVVICFQTDGEENSSTDHTWEGLKSLIAEKQRLGWQFNFLGAGIDAYQQGARMGIATVNTMSYDHTDPVKTRSAFRSIGASAASYSSGKSHDTHFSLRAKLDAGDAFDPILKQKPLPQAHVHLSVGRQKRKTVGDFSL